MSLETTVLIAILTLLSICLGASFIWVVALETAIQLIVAETKFWELLTKIRLKAVMVMSAILAISLILAIALNIIPHLRSEPYLLKIGLISFILFLTSAIGKFVFLESTKIPGIKSTSNNLLLWLNLLCITVSYWSFLHYALNPQI
ncbi:MAG: hypothetical protein ACFCAD_01095 [Pleurocapsa sp.]